ncbi:carboxylesterase/lipase family protein [Aquabacterium olei]|nr:carboxylesterase family protein [Aquabacterium olei]
MVSAVAGALTALPGLAGGASGSSGSSPHHEATPITLRLDDGLVIGRRDGDSEAFLGLPYAQPPVGEARWRAPRAASRLHGVRDARTPGPVCMQPMAPRGPEATLAQRPMSEDCLTLNIWRPLQRQHHALPIMVWLHGGAFRLGAGSLYLYNGAALAARQAILVTVNYRLGPFGFLAHPALNRDDEPGVNHGLLDQIAALRWIQDHARQLGGDPQRITLFGESAGGASVGYLMTTPLAKGLFHRAIIQSGALDLPERTRQQGEQTAARLLAPVAGPAPTAEDLRQLPARVLIDLPWQRQDTMPMVDGQVVRKPMRQAFRDGDAAPMPLLIGSNDAESGFFPPAWSQAVVQQLGDRWAAVRAQMPLPPAAGEAERAQRLATDVFATLPTWQVAQAHAGQAPVYLYRYGHVAAAQRGHAAGAIHTAELPLLFTPEGVGHPAREDAFVAAALQRWWTHFAHSGRPTPRHDRWPRLTAHAPRLMWIDAAGGQAITVPDRTWLDILALHPDVHAN